jgi:hypothetical protein
MRRLFAVLFSLLLANVAFGGVNETDPRVKEPYERLGRAMVLRTHQALSEADIADLASRGVVVKRALPGGRYIARVKDEAAAANDARITSVEPMAGNQKLHASVLHEAAQAKPYVRVAVLFHDDVQFDDARTAITNAGGALDDLFKLQFSPGRRISARVPAAALETLVADERVMSIIGPPRKRIRSDNLVSGLVSQVDVVQAAPYGLTGEGVTVSLFELAQGQATHPEFGGRLTVHALGGTASDKSHATHVAGTIAAAGVNNLAKGMAPKATIHQFCLAIEGQNQCTGDWVDDKDTLLQPLGIVADNNSWGYELGWFDEDGYPVWDGSDIFYGSYQPEYGGPFIDDISIARNVLFVHSAGNDGNSGGFSTEFSEHRHTDDEGDTITDQIFCYSKNASGTDCPALCNGTNPETGAAAGCEKPADQHHVQVPYDTIGVTAAAKNVIAVGAVSGIPGNTLIATLSSRGPAKDGRVKPDVVARGVNVFSSIPTDAYERKQGTSMASPVVTGIAALLTEQWRKTFAGASPLPQQLKALILAGAVDLGNPGPDYTYGFGLVNAKNSVDLILADNATGSRIRSLSFPQGTAQSRELTLTLAAPQNVRVLVNWPDPPTVLLADAEITDSVLINDLDLKVIGPTGETFLPYVLNRAQFTANATRGVNIVDNTEEVEIANAPAGVYRVIVTGTNVEEGPQPAVLVSNAALSDVVTTPVCRDIIENLGANNTEATAFGNLATGQLITAGLCVQSDIDFYKFNVTKNGPVSITITAGDTPIRATLIGGSGISPSTSVEVPANSSRTLQAVANIQPMSFLLKVEPTGAIGSAQYSFTATFGESHQPRRRSVGR